ncbi:AsmA family protein [Rhodanobacter sp. 7MK24]|uniref:AsmA family protein n=1 Tax=Rhodanobacter sp. 7MK24 TaxID=2775922 RepID=UPI001785533A|nr:AsmA family protein [Rhodanobacter sp. 7MK24]MBD8882069.1 AsmA family protein [Rhodanobacter sp. 7MK24]
MRRRYKLLAWVIGLPVTLLIVLVSALVITLSLFDWNRLKPTIDAKASTAIGRPFAINGDLGMEWKRDPQSQGWHAWLPWPHIVAHDISVANPAWTKQPQFAHLDAVRFSLSPLDLLWHHVRIPSLQLVNPSVDLERDAQGRANWTFNLPQSQTPSAWTVDLGAIGFGAGQVVFDDAAGHVQITAYIQPLQQAVPYDQIVAQATADARTQAVNSAGRGAGKTMDKDNDQDKPGDAAARKSSYQFAWSAQGSYQGAPLEGSGKTGAVLALQQSGQPFPLQAKLRIGDTHIALVGTLIDPLHLGALDLRLWLAGSSMAKLYPILGVTLPDTPPYATRGRLTATLARSGNRFGYHDFRAHVGASDIAGDVDYVTGGVRPKLSGKLQAAQLRFADLAPLVGGGGSSTTTPPPAASDRVLPTQSFRTDRWKAMDADVTFAAARIEHGPSLPIQSLSTHLVMDGGTLTLDPLHFGVAGGQVNGMVRLDGSTAPMRGRLKLGVRGLRIEQLSQGFASMHTSLGEINGDAELDARGNSVATLLGTASGELKLLMDNGAISRNLLEMAGLNVGNIVLGKLFGDKTVKIDCAASDFVAEDGLFSTRLFVVDTQDALIDVKGTVNFANEKLDLDVVPHTKGFRLFTLRSPLYVHGTLKQPDVGVHAGPLLARGAGALALGVVAAPAAALLALVAPSHDTGNTHTCTAVLQQLRAPAAKAQR